MCFFVEVVAYWIGSLKSCFDSFEGSVCVFGDPFGVRCDDRINVSGLCCCGPRYGVCGCHTSLNGLLIGLLFFGP